MGGSEEESHALRRSSSYSTSTSSSSSSSEHQHPRGGGVETVPSLPQRCVAAGIAACVSALVTNPLDVIKTRMQTSSSPYSFSSSAAAAASTTTTTTIFGTTTTSSKHDNDKLSLGGSGNTSSATTTHSTNVRWSKSTGGGGGGGKTTSSTTTTTTTTTTLHNCPPKCPTNANGVTNCVSAYCTTYDGNAWTVMRKIVRREGVSALWRGTKTALVMAGPAVGVYLPCYDFIRDYCVEHELVPNEDMAPLVAGAGARTIAVFAVAPLELMRTRQLAAQESGDSFMRYSGSSQRRSLLFTGVSSTLIRDVPFSMMYWYSVEKLRSALAGQFSNDNPKMDNLAAAFVGGNIAGAAISAVTTPGDVLKTRIQVNVTHGNEVGLQKGGRAGLFRELTNLVKHEGASSLFKGVVPRALRGGPTCGIVLVAYELVKSLDY